MKLPVVWLREADEELKEVVAWYHDIRPELADRFAQAVEATIEAIIKNPWQFPVVYRGCHRAGIRRFPYGVFFEIQQHQIMVIACFHSKRDPKHWQSR